MGEFHTSNIIIMFSKSEQRLFGFIVPDDYISIISQLTYD